MFLLQIFKKELIVKNYKYEFEHFLRSGYEVLI